MKKVFKFLTIILILSIISMSLYFYILNKPNRTVINYSDEPYIIIEDILIDEGEPIQIIDEEIYMSYDFLRKSLTIPETP